MYNELDKLIEYIHEWCDDNGIAFTPANTDTKSNKTIVTLEFLTSEVGE